MWAHFVRFLTKHLNKLFPHKPLIKDGPLFFLERGMKNIEKKNRLQGLKRQNKCNMICIKKIVCIEVSETCNLLMKKKTFQN